MYNNYNLFQIVKLIYILEYCENEQFNAECGSGEVIRIKSASYGRMKLNKCVTNDHGYLGCNVNRLSYLDHLCSGRRLCNVKIIDHTSELEDDDVGCPVDVSSYLDVEYECVKGKF